MSDKYYILSKLKSEYVVASTGTCSVLKVVDSAIEDLRLAQFVLKNECLPGQQVVQVSHVCHLLIRHASLLLILE